MQSLFRKQSWKLGELLELEPDRMYEILAEWDSGRGDARGFYGEACYLVVTE